MPRRDGGRGRSYCVSRVESRSPPGLLTTRGGTIQLWNKGMRLFPFAHTCPLDLRRGSQLPREESRRLRGRAYVPNVEKVLIGSRSNVPFGAASGTVQS